MVTREGNSPRKVSISYRVDAPFILTPLQRPAVSSSTTYPFITSAESLDLTWLSEASCYRMLTIICSVTRPLFFRCLIHWGSLWSSRHKSPIHDTQLLIYSCSSQRQVLCRFPNGFLEMQGPSIWTLSLCAADCSDSPVVSVITAFHAFTTGYGHLAAYNDIWIMWFSIPLMGGINKPIHCSTDESPFFQKLLLGWSLSILCLSHLHPLQFVGYGSDLLVRHFSALSACRFDCISCHQRSWPI